MPIRGSILSILTIFFVLMGTLVFITPIVTNTNRNITTLIPQARNDRNILKSLLDSSMLTNISGENQPKGIFFDPQNQYVYIANYGAKSVSVINTTSHTMVTTISTGASAWQLAYNPTNHYLYVSNDLANYITVINTTSNTVVTTISTGNHGYDVGVRYDPYNQLLYIETNQDNFLLVANTTTNKVISAIPVGNSPGNSNIAIDTNNHLYLADHLADTINIVDGNNNSVIKTIIVGKAPGATLYDPYNGYIYITLIGFAKAPENTIVVYDPVKDQIIKYLTVGEFPSMMSYDSIHHVIYELNIQSDSLGIINATTNTFLGSFPVGNSPTGIAFTTNATTVYVTNTGDNNVGYMNLSRVFSLLKGYGVSSTKTSLAFPLLSSFLGMSVLAVLYKKFLRIPGRK